MLLIFYVKGNVRKFIYLLIYCYFLFSLTIKVNNAKYCKSEIFAAICIRCKSKFMGVHVLTVIVSAMHTAMVERHYRQTDIHYANLYIDF